MDTEKFQNKYRISSARFSWHDYNGGIYFITICTAGMVHYFGEIEKEIMILSEIGKYVEENLTNITRHYPYCEIPLYVVMPNHIHLIVCIDGENYNSPRRDGACHVAEKNVISDNMKDAARDVSPAVKNSKMQEIAQKQGLLSIVIGGFKSAISRYANLHKIPFGWQARFHDRIIRNQKELNFIAEYIESNVIRWEIDRYNT